MRRRPTSCRSLGRIVTSWVNATAHQPWKRTISRWCWRSRGQCSPRPSMRIIGSSPCNSDRRRSTPSWSGSWKSGSVLPGSRCLLMSLRLLEVGGWSWADARDAQAHPVDAGERGDVEGPRVVVAPREVVRRLGEPQRAEVLATGRQHPDPARPTGVDVALAVDLEAVDGVLAGCAGHVVER